jgi:CRP/FNR family cyclic AMP-dependent transcriptional regulator
MSTPRAVAAATQVASIMRESKGGRLGKAWVEVLQEVPLFSRLSKRQLSRIANAAEGVRYERGSTIVREGARGDAFYVILDGTARVQLPGRRGRRLRAGQFFGEMALLDGSPRSATVTAEGELLAMRLPRTRFLETLEKEPKLALGLLQGLAERLRGSEKQALD